MEIVEQDYRGYRLMGGHHLSTQIWFRRHYRGAFLTERDARSRVDELESQRLKALIDIELMAMTDRALSECNCNEQSPRYYTLSGEAYRAGQAFFYHRLEAAPGKETEVATNVQALMETASAFRWGYEDVLNEHKYLEERQLQTDTDVMRSYQQIKSDKRRAEKMRELRRQTVNLIPHISCITHYDDLVKLSDSQLQHLHEIELLTVEDKEERDEGIEYRTSGHHRDILVIIEHASTGLPRVDDLGTIHMRDDGYFDFCVLQHFCETDMKESINV